MSFATVKCFFRFSRWSATGDMYFFEPNPMNGWRRWMPGRIPADLTFASISLRDSSPFGYSGRIT